MSKDYEIKFYGDKTNMIVINKYDEKGMFADIYRDCARILNDILSWFDRKDETGNNCISFVGRRGAGKTSAMMSFVKILEDKGHGDAIKNKYPKIKEKGFKSLTMIDPSLLEKQDCLLNYILGEMFRLFNKAVEEDKHNNSQDTLDKTKNLSGQFNRVLELLTRVSDVRAGKIAERGAFYTLQAFAATSSIKEAFGKLVESFLTFFGKDCLIIPIDDMDLQNDAAYRFTDEIKNYLVQKKILVLVNYDIDRYRESLANPYLKNSEKIQLYSHNDETTDLRQKVREHYTLVGEYMHKVFPTDQRVYLPTVQSKFRRADYEYYQNAPEQKAPDRNAPDQKAPESKAELYLKSDTLLGFVNRAIFEVTKIRFPHSSYMYNYIPHSLRELHNFIKDLFDELDFSKGDNISAIDHIRNWYASDTIYRWGRENLSREQSRTLAEYWELPGESMYDFIYKYLLDKQKTLPIGPGGVNQKRKTDPAYTARFETYKKKIRRRLITPGDIFYICNYFQDHESANKGKWDNFIFVLLLLTSIKMSSYERRLGEYSERAKENFDDNKEQLVHCGKSIDKLFGKEYFGYASAEAFGQFVMKKGSHFYSRPLGRIEHVYGVFDKDVGGVKFDNIFEVELQGFNNRSEKEIIKLETALLFFYTDGKWNIKYDKGSKKWLLTASKRVCFDILNPCFLLERYSNPVYSEDIQNKDTKDLKSEDSKSASILRKRFENHIPTGESFIEEKNAAIRRDWNIGTLLPLSNLNFIYDLLNKLRMEFSDYTVYLGRDTTAGNRKVEIEEEFFLKLGEHIKAIYTSIYKYLKNEDKELFEKSTVTPPNGDKKYFDIITDNLGENYQKLTGLLGENLYFKAMLKTLLNDSGGNKLLCEEDMRSFILSDIETPGDDSGGERPGTTPPPGGDN